MDTARYVLGGLLFHYAVNDAVKEGIVTLRALYERDRPSVPFDACSQFDALACFKRHREVIEQVAREVYARQAFWDDGRIHIVNGELPDR